MEDLKKQIKVAIDALKSQRVQEAEDLTKNLITKNPNIVFLYNLLGLILMKQKKTDQAIEWYEKGIKIEPSFAMIYNNLGLLFFENKNANYIEKAKSYYKKAISLDKKISEPHNNLGTLYNSLNNVEEAIVCYKKALDLNPKFSFAHHNLGSAYISIGKFSDARKHFKESIRLNPGFMDPHRSLSRLTKYTEKDKHFKELKKLYKDTNDKNPEKRIELGFALGKAYEDIKNFDKSFTYYEEANSLYRRKIDFSLKSEKEMFDEIKYTYNRKLFDKYKYVGYPNSSPIFIVGMPRSGTTLIEQIISSHPKVFGADEVHFIPNIIKENFGIRNLRYFFDGVVDFDKENFKKIGKDYISKMRNISNNSEKTTDKLPINFLSVGFIKIILPNSKIIHCYRNSEDNILSIFKNHFPGGKVNFGYNLHEIIQYYKLYHDLMKYWNNILPNFIYNIKYENLISNTKKEIHNLLKFCDLKWVNDCLNFHNNKRPIKTASDTQARSKIYSTSVSSWKNYEKYLKKYFLKLEN